jgi:hypothetical protein
MLLHVSSTARAIIFLLKHFFHVSHDKFTYQRVIRVRGRLGYKNNVCFLFIISIKMTVI